MASIGQLATLGLIAGVTIFFGLILARWRRMPPSFQPLFALVAAGVLVFLTIEVGYHAFEAVETPFRLGKLAAGVLSLAVLLAGLLCGLVALGVWEDRRTKRKASAATGIELATMTAIGIGVHNLGEGLAIGQSYAAGAITLGASLVAGFALHNATEGFGIVGGLRGERIGWARIGLLGLIGGGPTVLGAVVGGFWTSALLVTFCYALAAGSLLYVIRELLRIPFGVSAKFSLSALTAGLLLGVVTETVVEAAQTPTVNKSALSVQLTITGSKFSPAILEIPSGANLVINNKDAKQYTLEGAGILRGDVPVEASGSTTVKPLSEPGNYTIYVEEDPRMLLSTRVTGTAKTTSQALNIVQLARENGRQPVFFSETSEPQYGAYTAFNLTITGEAERQAVLKELYTISEQVSAEKLPAELGQYFTVTSWSKLRPSVAMVIGLGPGSYDAARFGPRVAATKPLDLHRINFDSILKFNAKKTQKDILIRITSDSIWYNQQICRYLWRAMGTRIRDATYDYGYSNPNGRSPILGGFFDGTGNPIGREREEAVFGKVQNGTYLAWFKIRFDEDRFRKWPLAKQQEIIGRVRESGRQLPKDALSSHRSKAEGDSTRTILRQPFVYDYSRHDTGLLFASVQASLTQQLEGILCGYMINASAPTPGTGKDRLIDYMRFLEGAYYYVPPVPKGGYPGMLASR